MNILIGKVEKTFKKILETEETIFSFHLDNSHLIEYTSTYKLEDEEWFRINEFSNKPFYIHECMPQFSTVSLSGISNKEYSKISCLCALDEAARYFQRVTPSLYINRRTLLDYSGDPKIVNHNKQITINETPDAIYLYKDDILLFRDISKIKTIFPGIEELQREATQPEVNAFLSKEFLELSGYSSSSVGVQNRKRIADIGVKFEKLTEEKKNNLIDYVKKNTDIEQNDGVFIINSDTRLKELLFAMDQRYYYADIYEESRIANSIRVIKS